jgi:4-hydroxybenzoate polyprenyltransferase
MIEKDPAPSALPWWERLIAVGQLMRVANVFSAVADVWMGLLLTMGDLEWPLAAGITAASALIYLAGTVLNDVYDHEIDAQERPERPIPSGRVSLGFARRLGWILLAGGVAAGWWTSSMSSNVLLGSAATLLAGLVVAYDLRMKQTLAGPAVMALCRVANVLLGMSLAGTWTDEGIAFDAPLVPALGIGLYILSVTWFARFEGGTSPRWILVAGASGVIASLALLAAMPWIEPTPPRALALTPEGWLLLWGVVTVTTLRRLVLAIVQPRPHVVQRAVGHAILSLIIIDASLVLGYGTPFWALAILLLIVPSSLLATWFKVS